MYRTLALFVAALAAPVVGCGASFPKVLSEISALAPETFWLASCEYNEIESGLKAKPPADDATLALGVVACLVEAIPNIDQTLAQQEAAKIVEGMKATAQIKLATKPKAP